MYTSQETNIQVTEKIYPSPFDKLSILFVKIPDFYIVPI
jgi:hypothetical protein